MILILRAGEIARRPKRLAWDDKSRGHYFVRRVCFFYGFSQFYDGFYRPQKFFLLAQEMYQRPPPRQHFGRPHAVFISIHFRN